MPWKDITYLKTGTQRQKEVYSTLQELNVLHTLRDYNATLVSTICLDIDVPESDLDIICQFLAADKFEFTLQKEFKDHRDFSISRTGSENSVQIVAEFKSGNFIIEIFGSVLPIEEQNAYRHLSVARRLIKLGGDSFREKLRNLKSKGFKTEAAIAELLNLSGDPYAAVLKLEEASDRHLLSLISVKV